MDFGDFLTSLNGCFSMYKSRIFINLYIAHSDRKLLALEYYCQPSQSRGNDNHIPQNDIFIYHLLRNVILI